MLCVCDSFSALSGTVPTSKLGSLKSWDRNPSDASEARRAEVALVYILIMDFVCPNNFCDLGTRRKHIGSGCGFHLCILQHQDKVDMKFSRGSDQGIISKIASEDNHLQRVEREEKLLFG